MVLLKSSNQKDIYISLILFLVGVFLLLYKFGLHPICMWDEAIYANNALEMAHSNNWWIIQNNGIPSHYNVKPPLAIWLQAISIKLFGANEWALRLPSVFAGIGIFILMLIYSKKWTNRYLSGALGVILAATCLGFNRGHVIRTADLDGILLFFTTWYTLVFISFLWLEKEESHFHFKLLGLVLLAFFTKSLAGLMPLFPLFVLSFFSKHGRQFLLSNKTLRTVLSGLSAIAVYYFLRDLSQPVYFQLVWSSEFLRFTHNIMSWHEQPFLFYVKNMWIHEYFKVHLFLLLIPLLSYYVGTKQNKNLLLLLLGNVCIFLIFISIPSVKLLWYDAHVYPILTFAIGLSAAHGLKGSFSWLAIFTILIGASISGKMLIKEINQTNSKEPLEYQGEMMKRLHTNYPLFNEYTVFMKVNTPEHLDQMRFYQKKYNWYNGYKISWADKITEIEQNDKILCCQPELIVEIENQFETAIIKKEEHCKLIQIINQK